MNTFFVICPDGKPDAYLMRIDSTPVMPRWCWLVTDAMKFASYVEATTYAHAFLSNLKVMIVKMEKLYSAQEEAEKAYDRAMGVV